MSTPKLPKTIGWIGLGLMGFPMAENLVKKMSPDTQFYVYDVVDEPVQKFVQQGEGRVHACQSSREVAEKCELLLTMVPEGSHARTVYLDPTTGVLAATPLRAHTLLDCSTIDPPTSLALHTAATTHHPPTTFTDTPVSGGVLGARAATLTFMLGLPAHSPLLPTLHPLLTHMGTLIQPCGAPGLGLTAKLANNYCAGLIAIATSEALSIGMAAGMDPRVLANVFHASTAQSAICDDWNPVPGVSPRAPASWGYAGGFRVELMWKDFGLATGVARGLGVRLALGAVGEGVYREAVGLEGCRGRDSRVVFRALGGDERWRDRFPGEVGMGRDETRRALAVGREVLARERAEVEGEVD